MDSIPCTIHCYCNIDTVNAANAADVAFITIVFIITHINNKIVDYCAMRNIAGFFGY
jgi:hypothetical protein